MELAPKQFCPLCQNPDININPVSGSFNGYRVSCERCKEFLVTKNVLRYTDIQDKLKIIGYILSAVSRELNETNQLPLEITTDNLDRLTQHHLIPNLTNIEAKAMKLLRRLQERSVPFGHRFTLSYSKDYPLAYAKNDEEFVALLRFLLESGYIAANSTIERGVAMIVLSAKGWSLDGRDAEQSKQGFIAIWFDDEKDQTILATKEAIGATGYIPVCLKGEHFADRIMDKALGEIRNSRFLIVDITEKRPSVFFEAGFAAALGKEIIYVRHVPSNQASTVIQNSTSLEFYVGHYQCHAYTNLDQLKEIIIDAISARLPLK